MRKPSALWRATASAGQRTRAKRVPFAFAGVVVLALLVPAPSPGPALEAPASGISMLAGQVPPTLVDPDTASVELGATFSSSLDGTVQAIRFYKTEANVGPHVVNLWSASGQVLATATLPPSAASSEGWQSVALPTPVPIASGEKYIAAYIAPHGRYSSEQNGLVEGRGSGPLTLHANGGVYAYGTGGTMPRSTYRSTNYFVDVLFTPAAEAGPVPGPVPSLPGTLPPGVSVRHVDGGTDYYQQFNNPLPADEGYFPVAVWYESLLTSADAELDKRLGLNSYLELTANSTAALAGQAGMPAITSWDAPGRSGSLLPDEVDMWAGAGTSAWTGNWPGEGPICDPAGSQCGYTIQANRKEAAAPGEMLFANYGKGVTFWESDAQAARFINDYPHVVSADNYWFTDPHICSAGEGGRLLSPQRQLTDAECRKAANYGWTVDRVRSLVDPPASMPVWAFVEVGHPFGEDSAPTITADQIKAAVWSSLIHGARGIIYFNHNFGGSCQSQHVLRDACGAQIRPAVAALNTQIKDLAPVLNAPFLDGAASTPGAVDLGVKIHGGSLYVFAASTTGASQQVEVSVECSNASSATVLGEDRVVPVRDGVLADSFADGNTVHLYQLDGSNSCGL